MKYKLKDIHISKRMRIMLISVGVLFGCIFLYKVFVAVMIHFALANNKKITAVSVMKVSESPWQPKISAVGSLRAIHGVNVTTELAGMVQTIYFTPGSMVAAGAILVQLNADAEIGQLQSLQAQQELAKITYNRDNAQYAIHAISKQVLDTDYQNFRNLQGQVAQQAATVAKKTIRAPFSGRLGINNVNLGQYINTGDIIVNLQTLNPIWLDFYLPQQSLSHIKVGMNVVATADAYPGKKFPGTITTINPAIDVNTRNVEVEATINNPTNELTPGMFATVEVDTGKPKKYLTLPQTAITFNPYGSVVYIVRETGKDKNGEPILTAKQAFVITGETRGEQIQVLKGLKVGDTVVTSGQLKLRNNSPVSINNAIQPSNKAAAVVTNEH